MVLRDLMQVEGAIWREVDGVEVPARYTTLEQEVSALRGGVGLSDRSYVCVLRLRGEDAYDLLDRCCPCAMYIRDGEVRHTVLLSEQGTPILDLYVGNDDESFFVFSEGKPAQEVLAYWHSMIPEGADIQIEPWNETHALLGLNGPFAWELLAELEGHQVIGFPYATFYRSEEENLFFRLGKTGEYGYDILVPRDKVAAYWARVLEVGRSFDIRPVGFEALEHAGLENFFFSIRREGALGLTPIELQLQWRVSYEKDFLGRAALEAVKTSDARHRVTGIRSAHPLGEGGALYCEGECVGEVVVAMRSVTLGAWIGLGLLALPWAQAGLALSTDGAKEADIRTVSMPFVRNMSMLINPQKHSYRDAASLEALRRSLSQPDVWVETAGGA